jgi:hypothetical protein
MSTRNIPWSKGRVVVGIRTRDLLVCSKFFFSYVFLFGNQLSPKHWLPTAYGEKKYELQSKKQVQQCGKREGKGKSRRNELEEGSGNRRVPVLELTEGKN